MGRPSSLTPELQERICDAIRDGRNYDQACTLAGIHRSTFMKWRAMGRAATRKTKYRDFLDATVRAREEWLIRQEALIEEVGHDGERVEEIVRTTKPDGSVVEKKRIIRRRDWKAVAWLMERRHPERYGQRQKLEHGGGLKHEGLPAAPTTVLVLPPEDPVPVKPADPDGDEGPDDPVEP